MKTMLTSARASEWSERRQCINYNDMMVLMTDKLVDYDLDKMDNLDDFDDLDDLDT